MNEHDNSYKLLFSFPEVVADLLTGFVHEPWVAEIDLSTLELVSGNYVTDDLRDREDDIVWRVKLKGIWLYVYLLLEFQSTVDLLMALRVVVYEGLLYQDMVRTGAASVGAGLPPIFPVVLYTGDRKWNAAQEVGDVILPAPGGLDDYKLHGRYMLLDKNEYAEAALGPLKNLVTAIFKLEGGRTPESMLQVLARLSEWIGAPEQAELRRAFTIWIRRVLMPNRLPGVVLPEARNLQEVKTMLEENVYDWTIQWKEQGIQQGEAAILTRVLERRFGPLDEGARERITAADAGTLLEWADRVLTAQRVEEVLR